MKLFETPLPEIDIGVYMHYKGTMYNVLGVSCHSETYEPMVMYRALTEESITWTRPYSMFFDMIESNGKQVRRFEKVTSNKGN
jgi:hypothetical protein